MTETDVTKQHPFPFRPDAKRTPGLHLSDILKLMREEWLSEKYTPNDELTDAEMLDRRLTWEVGRIWEDTLSVGFGWPFTQRWEDVELDGILLNPDHRFRLDDGWVEEFKMTSRSANTPPSAYLPYIWQLKAYCWALSTEEKVYNGRIRILFYHGDYKGNRNPIYKCFEYIFGYQELHEAWQAIINFAKARGLLK